MWVLKDAKKHEWTKHIYVLPFMWRKLVANTKLCIVGMTSLTCELVLSPYFRSDPYSIFYYNLEMNSVKRFGIRGFKGVGRSRTISHLFLDYVEDVKFI